MGCLPEVSARPLGMEWNDLALQKVAQPMTPASDPKQMSKGIYVLCITSCGILAVESWLWSPGCEILAVKSWVWNPGCGILAVES